MRKKTISAAITAALLITSVIFGCRNSATPRKNKVQVFGILIDSASYHAPSLPYGPIDLDNSLKEVDKAEELGVDFVRIDLRNETLQYPDEMAKIDTIVNYARSKGLKIYIGVYGMESWLPDSLWQMLTHPDGGAGKANWDDFKDMYKNQAIYLANRYHPDYMMIMVELRFNLGNQVNSVRTIDEWVQFTKVIVDSIKSISPDTKIVLDEVARSKSTPSSVEFIKAIMQDNYEKIDILAIDPYSYSELEDEVSTIVELRKNYDWHGEIWVGETNLLTFSDENEQKDYFLYAIDLADKNGFTGFCIFYFRDGSGTTGNNGILHNDFTPKPAYDAIKQIIQQRR